MSSISESLSSAAPILIDSPQTAATQNALNPQISEVQSSLSIGDMNTCPICLDDLNDPCHGDSCTHEFCFACLIRWTNTKAECPLCKEPIEIIRHNIFSENVYDDFVIPTPLTEQTFTAHNFRPYQADQLELPEVENPAQIRNFFRKVIGVALSFYLMSIVTASISLYFFREIPEVIKMDVLFFVVILNSFSFSRDFSGFEPLSGSSPHISTLLLSCAILNGVAVGIWTDHSLSLYDFLLVAKYTLLIIVSIVIRIHLQNYNLNDLRARNHYLRKPTVYLHLLHISIFLTYVNQNDNFNLTTLEDGRIFLWLLKIFISTPGLIFIVHIEQYCIELLRNQTERKYRNRFFYPVLVLYVPLILLLFYVSHLSKTSIFLNSNKYHMV